MFKQGQSIPPVVFFRVNTINITLRNKTNHTTINTYVHFQTFVQAYYRENFFLRFFIFMFLCSSWMFSLLLSSNGFNMAYNNRRIIVVWYSLRETKTQQQKLFFLKLEKIWVSKVNQVYIFCIKKGLLRLHVWEQLMAVNFVFISLWISFDLTN